MIVAALVLAASLDVQAFVEPFDPEAPRPLLIPVRDADGKVRLAKRSAKTVACRTCGGVLGDPFESVHVEKGRFTVEHYGGIQEEPQSRKEVFRAYRRWFTEGKADRRSRRSRTPCRRCRWVSFRTAG